MGIEEKEAALLKVVENTKEAVSRTDEIYEGFSPFIRYYACVAIKEAGLEWYRKVKATPAEEFSD